MLFERRGARTAVARAFVGSAVAGRVQLGGTGWMDRGVQKRADKGMLLIGAYLQGTVLF